MAQSKIVEEVSRFTKLLPGPGCMETRGKKGKPAPNIPVSPDREVLHGVCPVCGVPRLIVHPAREKYYCFFCWDGGGPGHLVGVIDNMGGPVEPLDLVLDNEFRFRLAKPNENTADKRKMGD